MPTEEADGVREALDNAKIEFYETPQANWGRSTAAIWVKDNGDFDTAREVISAFQVRYTMKVKSLKPTISRVSNWKTVYILIAVACIFLGYLWVENWR